VIADDHPVVRDGLRALLGSLGGVCVVGEAATGREAVRQAVTLRPDVLVLDLRMPDLDGVQATRQVVRDAPAVAVLVLTTFDDDDNLQDAVRAGARGYLLKGASQEEIARAIGVVAAGGAVTRRPANGGRHRAEHRRARPAR
jgi:DNA-binding NarL/FixJ family response regulator